jgi:hypothetical protein
MMRNAGAATWLALGLALIVVPPAAGDLTLDQTIALVPADGTVADIMAPGTPPIVTEITEKLQHAAGKDPAWWQEYIKDVPSGTPIPYHPKMEITEEEYRTFLELSAQQTLIKYGEIRFTVQALHEGLYRISVGDTVPEMDGIEIDLLKDRINTPFGQAARRTAIHRSSEGQKLTGTWEGVQWEHLEMDTTAMRGLSIHFALGKLDATGEALLYYRVYKVNPNEPPTDVMILLTYAVRENEIPSR